MINNKKEEKNKLIKRVLLAILFFSIILIPFVILLGIYSSDLRNQDIVLFGIPELLSAISGCVFILIILFIAYLLMAFLMTKLNLRLPSYPFMISGNIKGGINKNMLNADKPNWSTFYRADDEKLIIKRKNTLATFTLAGICLAIGLFFFFCDVAQNKVQIETANSLVIISIAILNCIYNLIRPTKYIEFNRLKGTITVTGFMLPFRTRTIPFNNVKVIAFTGNLTLTIPYRILNIWLIGEPTQEWWSFYVWYMDRNRSLPQGTLFDPYRKKDYERRKAEGFAAPLYQVWGSYSEQMRAFDSKLEK